MTSKWVWLLSLLGRRLWFRTGLISVLAVLSALAGLVISPYIPQDLSTTIGADAVDNILSIIASSMLAVTTFSLSTMVASYSAATTNVTPRATKLLVEDSTTQNVLATFIGSFLFSLVAIITLAMDSYGEHGRVVLFVVTLGVVLLVVVTLLRWIDYLVRLGRVGETNDRVEQVVGKAMRDRKVSPWLGGMPLRDMTQVPPGAVHIGAAAIGYVQHVDMAALQREAEKGNARIYVLAPPGTFIDARRPLAACLGDDAMDHSALARCFTIGKERSFDQDPRFGLSVMAEIASRALSPAVNDAGTAIDIIGRSVRVLSIWADETIEESDERLDRIHVPGLDARELFDDIFTPIARDGAANLAVQIRLQKALHALSLLGVPGFREAAQHHKALALARARTALMLEEDMDQLRHVATQTDSYETIP